MSTYIGFSRPRKPGLLTKLAMWMDKSEVSHVFMAYEDTDWKCTIVIQVDEYGFRLIPLSKYVKKNHIANWVDMNSAAFGHFEEGLGQVAREFAGEMYDFKGFFGMAWVLISRMFKRRIKNPLAAKNTIICSETAVLALQYAGAPRSETLVADSTSPQELLNFLRS